MNSWIIGLAVLLHYFCYPTFAGNEKGGGGGGVVCRNEYGDIESVQLLDFFEEPSLSRTHFPEPAKSIQEKVEAVLSYLSSIDPIRGARYLQTAKHFFEHVEWKRDLPASMDFGYVELPPRCSLAQLAFQPRPIVTKRLWINPKLWSLLSVDARAGLILHEIVYNEAIRRGQRNSIYLRHFIRWLTFSSSRQLEISPEIRSEYLLHCYALGLHNPGTTHGTFWEDDTVRVDVCVGRRYQLDLISYLRTSGESQVKLSVVLKSGEVWPQMLSSRGRLIDLQINMRGAVLFWLFASANGSVATTSVLATAHECP